MVAEGDDIGPCGEQGSGHVRGKAEAVRGILSVDDGKLDPQILPQAGQSCRDRLPAGSAEHITQKKYPQFSPRTG